VMTIQAMLRVEGSGDDGSGNDRINDLVGGDVASTPATPKYTW
jgi:hypothetical protein